MPLFELEATRRGRRRVFVRAQLPFVAGAAFLYGAVAVGSPASLATPLMLGAAVVIALISAAALLVPWERHAPSWLILVAVGDIVAVALLRAELLPILPTVTMLSIFPILWLAYGFPPAAFLVAVGGAAFITSFTFLYHGIWPTTALEWVNVITLPGLILAVAVVVNIAAQTLRRNAARLAETTRDRAAALQRSLDDQLVLRTILDTVNGAVSFYDPGGRLTLANRAAERVAVIGEVALDRPPHAGRHVWEGDRATPIPPEQQAIPRALRGENLADELEWLGTADTQIAVLCSSAQVRRPDGSLLGTIVAAYDVTELAEAVEVREDFLRAVSHELRTPLTSVTGYVDLIAERVAGDPTLERHLGTVQRNVTSLTERINELLAAGANDSALRPRTVVLSELIAAAVDAVSPMARSRGTSLQQVNLSTATVEVDPLRMQQALRELLTNAVKFSPPSSAIVIDQHVEGATASISVSDPGPGLTRGEQARMFDRFYRTPYARRNAIQGFGIGLTLVRSAAQAHGGRVRVVTAPGEGTTMTLEFPSLRPESATHHPAHAPEGDR